MARGFSIILILLGALLTSCDEVAVNDASSGQTLCYDNFQDCVNPIFNAPIKRSDGSIVTCASGGCHEVGAGFGGAFKIFPNAALDSTEMNANFIVAKAFANLSAPPDSKLLLEPLQGVSSITGSHTGGDIFPSSPLNPAPSCYTVILNWINQKVNDSMEAQCINSCVNFVQCGFP